MELRFTVYGPLTSANAFKAPLTDDGGVVHLRKTKRARQDAARIKEIATVASTGWEIPEAVGVVVTAWCSRLDADNTTKVMFDALKGIAWRDDRDLMSLQVYREWDDGGERYEVSVFAVPDRRPGRKARAKKAAPSWVYGDPVPEGHAICDGKLIPTADALKLAGVR